MFLGYEPWNAPTTEAEKLRAAQLRRGWSRKQTARELSLDEASYARAERGVSMSKGITDKLRPFAKALPAEA